MLRHFLPGAEGTAKLGRSPEGQAERVCLAPPLQLAFLFQLLCHARDAGRPLWRLAPLTPTLIWSRGVNEVHFVQQKAPTGLRSVLDQAGIAMDESEFESIFLTASALEGHGMHCSIQAFMHERNTRLKQAAGL
jgi:hypothetical protein